MHSGGKHFRETKDGVLAGISVLLLMSPEVQPK